MMSVDVKMERFVIRWTARGAAIVVVRHGQQFKTIRTSLKRGFKKVQEYPLSLKSSPQSLGRSSPLHAVELGDESEGSP